MMLLLVCYLDIDIITRLFSLSDDITLEMSSYYASIGGGMYRSKHYDAKVYIVRYDNELVS
jgi:hypothetical protein